MKRFLQKSYSWLATLLFAVAFAVSGSASAQDVVFKLDASADPNSDLQVKTDKGVTITYHQYGGVGNLYSYGWPFEFSSANGNIEKIVLVTSETLNDVYVATGTWAAGSKTWTGSASSVTIETSGDHYVTEAQVWLEEGAAGGETGGEVIGIEMPLYGAANGTKDGVIFNFVSRSWDGGSANLYGNGGRNASYGIATFDCFDKNIVKVEFTCALNGWGAAPTPADAAMTVVETENLGGSFTTNGAVAIWEGSAHNLTFSSTDDLDVTKVVVYVEAGGEVVKECTVGVDHYADNCKPGKHETPFSRYITLYMQENTATTSWTGSDNCPAEVTLTNEAGQNLPISQFNYWQNSDQIGVVLEENITTPGVYTLHIPEGLVPFASGKFNKEINATWTVVAPDTRPTKDIVFDFTDGNYTNDGTLSYTKDGVVFTLNENRYNATAQGFRIATDGWVSFAAPEKATIKSIQLLQESSYGVSPDFTANVGEVSVYDKTLYWSGDDASVTLTDHYGTCYFTKAIVTLAVEESVEPTTTFKGVVTPNLTSVSSLDELEGIQLTLVDADKVSVLEESYGIYVQNEDGGEVYAVWDPYYGGTYEIDGNVITLRNFYSDSSNSYFAALPAGEFDLYFEDYGTFDVSNAAADWDGYFQTFTVAYKGAPAPVPFELVFRNNNVVCENGQKVEANEAGVGVDFYLENEGLTAVGKTATLYKDGNAMSFVMTLIDGTSVSFLGGSSLITEPGTYLLEVPEGTYVDAAGNPSVAYYGTWVVIQKDEPVVDPDEACFNAWVALVNGEFANIANEYGNEIPAQDIVGKKPIAVAVPCIEFYVNRAGLAGMGAILGWQVVNGFLNTSYNTTLAEDYAYAKALLEAYNAAEVVTEVVVEPTYTEPVLSAEDVSAEVAYYIYTDARGGLTVDGDQLKGTKEVGKNVDPTDVAQQFAFVNWEGNLYLYSLAAEKFIGKANRGNFTDEPVDPIYFKNASNGTVMLYFDDSFNFNLGGSNQVTIDTWKQKDAGNSFKIMVAEKFDQTALLEKLAGGGEVVDPVDLEQFAGTWYFKGEGAYLNYYEEDMTPKDEYVVNVEAKDGKLYMTDLVGFVYDVPNAFIGTYDAQAETLTFNTPYTTCYVVDNRYEYYTNFQPLVFNVVKDEEGNVSLVNTTGWDFMYEDWYYTTYACGYTSCVMTREQQIVDPEPEGWNGNILYSEANRIDDLLALTVEFEDANTVEAAGSDVLGVVFEENGNPYAIVLGNGVFDVFGGVSFDGSKATVEFVKIADLSADLQASAKASAARIGGFTSEGKASVVFASKSFKVDGNLVTDIIVNNYEFNGSEPTGVESIATSKVDTIFDLGGRRVVNTNGGLYIVNGRKVYMK